MKTCYVNTGSTAGGDGTTNTTSGTHRAYASLNEFESSEQDVLTEPIEAICEGTTVDNTVVLFDGWTTSSGNYISIKTTQANRHDGKWNTNKYRMETSAADNSYIIEVYEDYARVDGLQLDVKYTNTNTIAALYFHPKMASSTCEFWASNNVIRMSAAHSADASKMIRGILINGDDAAGSTITNMFWNNIVYGFGGAHSAIGQIMMYSLNSTMTNYLYNNTCASGNKAGYRLYGGTCYAKNNIALDCTDNWYLYSSGSWHADSIKNTSDTGDAPGSDAVNGEPIFVDKWGSDYHLDSTDTVAKDNWANIYADSVLPITTDIDGDVRPNSAAGDIGADEYTGGDIKSINNILWANIKSINNILIADTKSVNGITA